MKGGRRERERERTRHRWLTSQRRVREGDETDYKAGKERAGDVKYVCLPD